ncbi:MAG: hypothetical protein LBQ93_11145 [Treponema sp.]|jgi:hypothetical protein|nr:hypothetical protein [Treponema sp.]
MDNKKLFEKFDKQSSFIKVTAPGTIESQQKAALNRKGNQLFNNGNIEGAKRVFITTGYSDGLARVGDFYKSKNKPLEALRMYWLAPDRKKAEPLIEQLAGVLQSMLQEDKENDSETDYFFNTEQDQPDG